MKTFKGKAIYNPSGKAGKYSYWACNFYKGCSNGCTYCYLKTGVLADAMGGYKTELKACFKSEEHALKVFEKELKQNIDSIREHGLFFTFISDPMLNETIMLTQHAVFICCMYEVPVKILTKCTWWLENIRFENTKSYFDIFFPKNKTLIAFGFTLTGHDELEPGASPNAERIEAMKQLHDAGFRTFASIEPIIDFDSSLEMIYQTIQFCDLYKIGFKSGQKYDKQDLSHFMYSVENNCKYSANRPKIYWKDSILKLAGINRSDLTSVYDLSDLCVTSDYNLFETR